MTARTAVATLCLLAACSSATTQAPSGGGRDRLTHDQLVATNSGSVYDALEKLRPEWLTSRGPTSLSDSAPTVASVYMNGTMLGRTDSLKDIRVVDINEVRYWPAGQAAAKFGMGHPRGVIELIRT